MAAGPPRRGRPPRPRGQHFLRSGALAATLVAEAGIEAGELAVDIGAGRGILTRELAACCGSVWAVEEDATLAAELRRRFADAPVTVLEGDARALRPPALPFVVVANMPFAGATQILRVLLDDPGVPLQRAVVVLQWEAALKRAAVWPSTMRSALWGAWYDVRLTRRLPRAAFAPPPAVDAGVVRYERRREPLVPVPAAGQYRRLLASGFASQRPVRAVLPARLVKRLALEHGFAPDAHARDLDARQWAAVFAAVRRTV